MWINGDGFAARSRGEVVHAHDRDVVHVVAVQGEDQHERRLVVGAGWNVEQVVAGRPLDIHGLLSLRIRSRDGFAATQGTRATVRGQAAAGSGSSATAATCAHPTTASACRYRVLSTRILQSGVLHAGILGATRAFH